MASGINGHYSSLGNASTEHLTSNAAAPGTNQNGPSRFSENVSTSGDNVSTGAAGAGAGAAGGAAAAAPAAKKPLWKRRWFIIVSIINACIGIALLFIVLFPVVAAIAQSILNKSVLHVTEADISNPTNGSFTLGLTGFATHTGIFSAWITFTEPVNVSWVQGKTLTPLGVMRLDRLHAKHHRATIQQTTQFNITDQDAFVEFSKVLITQQNFTWELSSNNLNVAAEKFPVAHHLHFKKQLTLNGFNSFSGNVTLLNFLLPSDAPQGGINFEAKTGLVNPSPFKLNLGTTIFGLSYKGLFLGSGTSSNTIIAPASNNITLDGVLVPQSGTQNLSLTSELFTAYLNGEESPVIASGQSAVLPDGSTVSWLSAGLQALHLNVPFKSAQPISPIKSISIGSLSLAFTPDTEWAPLTNSDSVQASMELPFGFSVGISEISNAFNITRNDGVVAGLSTPLGASTSDIHVLGSTDTKGTIDIKIDNSSLASQTNDHPNFSSFNAFLTDSETAEFQLAGHARAVANTSIGAITLDPINFDVTSQLQGLQGLKGMTVIESIDVVGGQEQGLDLAVNVSIHNPSNLNLDTGDLNLQLLRDGNVLGTTLLPNLKLNIGDNSIQASAIFAANGNAAAKQTLNQFVARQDVPISIAGASFSTEVASLLEAFQTLNIGATLPGLKTTLLNSGSLTVLSTTGIENNITNVAVQLNNPFTAELDITQITSTVKSFGIPLGTINTNTSFNAGGKQTSSSPNLAMTLNLDPSSIFTVTRQLAVEAGLATEQLDGIVQIGGYNYLPINTSTDVPSGGSSSSSSQKRANIFTGFNLPNFVDTAFKQLQSDIELSSIVTIGNYTTTLDYEQTSVPIKTDDSLNLLLPILAHPIVQKIVSASVLGIDSVLISDVAEESFKTALSGSITNAGPFDARISFPAGLVVEWSGSSIGQIAMDDIQITGDVGGTFNVGPTFHVTDVNQLAAFSKVLLTEEEFTWTITGQNLSVDALGITVPGIVFGPANVTLKGFNGLKNGVKINSFDLPSNDPAGGIHLTIDSSVANPSQVGISLDSLTFLAFANDTQIGIVSSNSSFTLKNQATTELGLAGRLIPQDSQQGLNVVAGIFNNFIHGKDSAVSVHGQSATPSASWLNSAIPSLQVDTTLPNMGVLDLIKSIDLDDLQLLFTEDTAYDPSAGSNTTTAAFTLPFTLPVDIVALEGDFILGSGGQSIAVLNIPQTQSSTDINTRIITLGFHNVPLSVFGDKHSQFNDFVASVTTATNQSLQLSGSTSVNAQTGVGVLPLTDIAFNVMTSLAGLQGLNVKQTTVGSLDVAHGFPDFLLITTTAALFNPSNLTIGTGDADFGLQFSDQTIGSALIDNLVITPGTGNYSVNVHFAPQGAAAQAAGLKLLENYISGNDSSTAIVGSTDSTPIQSLQEALSEIKLSPVIINGINVTLITATHLEFPTDIVHTGIAQATFDLSNPFTASLNLLEVTATAVFNNLTLGEFDHVDLSSNPIHGPGHSTITSPSLPFKFNLDPATIISLLLQRSQETGTDLGPLPGLFAEALANPHAGDAINTTVDTSPPTCVSGQQFDVNDAILNSLKGLKVNLNIESETKIDDFGPLDLTFQQNGVPAVTDQTALFLIGAVAPPVVQLIVDQADLSFSQALIDNITEEGFDLALKGKLVNTGPLDALITFTEPVTVTWENQDIAQIALAPICAAANSGVPDYETNAHLTITDLGAFTNFATFLLHEPSFDWTIHTDKLRVTALGTIFDNVVLSKNISFKAFNGLPGVTITNFKLPSDVPDGIEISTDSMIPSPSNLGIDLGTVDFNAFFENVLVGPLTANNLDLAPLSTVTTHLTGEIVKQSGNDLNVIGELFSQFLAGNNQTLNVQGVSIQPPGQSSPVQWLSDAFKTLTLNVTLPGQKFKIIDSITLEDFELEMINQNEAFAPLSSSRTVDATFQNPFGFSLQVVQSGENITLGLGGTSVASLNVPMQQAQSGVSTGNVAPLVLSFSDVPLQSLNNGGFQQLFAGVTDTSEADFELKGTANVVARTNIGDVPISGIPFDVPSSLKGIDAFGGKTTLSNVSIVGSGGDGGDQFIKVPLMTELNNPSNISLSTVDVSLAVTFQGTKLGRAVLNSFNLTPGDHQYAAEFHYMPDNANDTTAQQFLTDYLQSSDNLPLTIEGDVESSPFASLIPALEGVKLQSSLTGLNVPPIITHINVFISVATLIDNMVEINFDIANPLDADLVIELVQSSAKVNGETFAQFTEPFQSFVVPAHGTANSGTFGNVLLTQGAIASLPIIPLGFLDISAVSSARVGEGGYLIPWLHLQQDHVPTDYSIDLIGGLGGVTSILGGATSILSGVIGNATSIIGGVTSVVGGVTSALGGVGTELSSVESQVGSGASSVLSGVGAGATSAASDVSSVASGVVGGLTSALGGLTAGPKATQAPEAEASSAKGDGNSVASAVSGLGAAITAGPQL